MFAFIRNSLMISCLALVLSSCGFHLKKASDLPQDLMSMEVSATDMNSALYDTLLDTLDQANVSINENLRANSPTLFLVSDSLDRRTLSLFKNGQVAEYELIYSVRYTLTRAGEAPNEQYFELYRNYQDDPDNALAKANEMKIIVEEMRRQAAHRIVRELATL